MKAPPLAPRAKAGGRKGVTSEQDTRQMATNYPFCITKYYILGKVPEPGGEVPLHPNSYTTYP